MKASLGFRNVALLITLGALGCTAHHHSMQRPAEMSVRVGTPNPPIPIPVPEPKPEQAYDFQVSFQGIIAHVAKPAGGLRAVVINGNLFSMQHNGRLIVEKVDRSSLRDLTGQPVHCETPKDAPDFVDCSVRLRGIDMQILDQDESAPQGGPLVIDQSFDRLVPHLASKETLNGKSPDDYGQLNPTILSHDFPTSPVGAYFEIANAGTLVTCPLNGHLGRFNDTNGSPLTDWKQFGNTTYWYGRTSTRATLFIRSLATNWQWKPVKLQTPGALIMTIKNFPSDDRSSTAHFVLNGKILPLATLSLVEDKRVNDECDGLKYCFTCLGDRFDVAGCSNSQWP